MKVAAYIACVVLACGLLAMWAYLLHKVAVDLEREVEQGGEDGR